MSDEQLHDWLAAAGLEPVTELAPPTVDDATDDGIDDPWADVAIATIGLTDEQLGHLVDGFADEPVTADELASVDDEIIDFPTDDDIEPF